MFRLIWDIFLKKKKSKFLSFFLQILDFSNLENSCFFLKNVLD